jgi:hypothetical protein
MTIEFQSETVDGTRVALTLKTLNLDTHSRIQELDPKHRMILESELQHYISWLARFISENTVKKTA